MNTQAEDGALLTARALLAAEEYACARTLLVSGVERARDTGATRLLALLLAVRSELDFRIGRWRGARCAASESLALCQALQEHEAAAGALDLIARLDAAEGHAADCLRHIAQSRRLIPAPLGHDTEAVEGFLALGLGDSQRTIELLEPLAHCRWLAESLAEEWASDLIEAYARSGRGPEARRLLRRLQVQARRAGRRRRAFAATARGSGLLAAADAFEGHFRRGLEPSLTAELPFERARTELCYGERLRRSGHRRDSRSQLSSALDTFDALGAEPWAMRARGELRTSGEHVRVDPGARTQLTPQELRVAYLVARGQTNREAATSLFVSEKTIEFHLRSIFRKLGVRSRAQLAYQVGRAEARRELSGAGLGGQR